MAGHEPGKTDVWTIGRILRWTTEYLATHGIDSPRLTSEMLLAHCLKASRIDLYMRFDEPLNQEERAVFRDLVRRRTGREPVAHIVGERSFWTLDLASGPEALVPRPDTETLVTEALKYLPENHRAKVLDLGTGTGCIALALATERPLCQVVAADLSLAACGLAMRNIRRVGLEGRVLPVVSDWCASFRQEPVFDLVVSNPPYIPTAHMEALSPEVRDYEPPLALDGGADGLLAYRRLAAEVGSVLKPSGILVLEIGYDQCRAVTTLFVDSGDYEVFPCVKDLGGHDRVVVLRKMLARTG
ncbi:peptide chain release factor N(5)-glutamine methyltransferase [Desulfobotulus sp. H1]|uniref:Release factor glutamine methyltransferase n=1 Tax=Desulfobotulus pelophilus TaxID=2823377 RepID=A0ABT3N5B8_9BACT|nr:peptide chain release factor N(5)-glutamine methyltransferase [Desulfobotulus pelophilus]MCW7752639.1 peptide chain release factor N(5)-glutamine methyltransferase [Desulfobotulus pelophilus]